MAVAALFAIDPTEGNTRLLNLLPGPAEPMEHAFTEALYQAHDSVSLADRANVLEKAGHRLVSLWTIAVAAPPPDPPDAPEVDIPPDGTQPGEPGAACSAARQAGQTTWARGPYRTVSPWQRAQ